MEPGEAAPSTSSDDGQCAPPSRRQCALYADATVLAPMVRAGTLPLRLLALDYGADLVYTEEIIDYKFVDAVRTVDESSGLVEFAPRSDVAPTFTTLPSREKGKVIFQLGTNDPERALRAAKIVERDVAGVDVNMGCPKSFSVKGGMGAALLRPPRERAQRILRTLVDGLRVPVTCKVRVLDNDDDTVHMCKLFAACGISAIAVHGRRTGERPKDKNRDELIAKIAAVIDIPVIASGGSSDIAGWHDIDAFRRRSGASSVMLARAALRNVSIFRRDGPMDTGDQVIRKYLQYCYDYKAEYQYTKYVLQRMLGERQQTCENGRKTLAASTMRELLRAWAVECGDGDVNAADSNG